LYLNDIRAAAEKVLRYTQGVDLARFVDDEKTFDAVVRNLEIIDEAAKGSQKYNFLHQFSQRPVRGRMV
jgi:uncharacterized protein with HEPN domain